MFSLTEPALLPLHVNGQEERVLVRPEDTLLDTLRNTLGLTGAKRGCENGDCGACTVLVAEEAMKSCLLLTTECLGREVRTVEGLRHSLLQEAFLAEWAFQCGYCTPGFLMLAEALLARHPDPDPETVTDWLRSNLCRCTGYREIRRAVMRAAVKHPQRPKRMRIRPLSPARLAALRPRRSERDRPRGPRPRLKGAAGRAGARPRLGSRSPADPPG
jgi:carbon-monoxide dehydrogenase small subunit